MILINQMNSKTKNKPLKQKNNIIKYQMYKYLQFNQIKIIYKNSF